MAALFAVPGKLETPTGGYVYARKLLDRTRESDFQLVHWPLPDGFPFPSDAALHETSRRLLSAPAEWPILIDGLALGVMPTEILDRLDNDIVALCHHPLALETGLAPDQAEAFRKTETAALARARHVITTSRTTAATLTREFDVPPEKIQVALPGVEAAGRARGSGRQTVEILTVGAIVPRKGHDLLIRALARLTSHDWRLTIVGAERDREYAAALRALVAARGLSERVLFHGAAGEDEMPALYANADLFALASHYEGFGMVYAEAIAHGLPVIGTAGGAVAEATMGAARLVEPGDEEGLVAALGRVLADPAERLALAAKSGEAMPALPDWNTTARRVTEVLRTLAGPRNGSAHKNGA